MSKLLFSVVFSLFLSTACSEENFLEVFKRESSKEEFDMKITEDGKQYMEKVTVNQANKNIIHDVPAHKSIPKAHILEDFASNSIVTRLPKLQVCYIQPKSSKDPSLDNLKKSMEKVSGGKAKVKAGFRVIKSEWKVKGLADKSRLSNEIIEFCRGMKIYDVVLFEKDGALVFKETSRRKRAAGFPLCRSVNDLFQNWKKCDQSRRITRCRYMNKSCFHFVTCTSGQIQLREGQCTSVHSYSNFQCCETICP